MMKYFPLGLRVKLYVYPWMTALIVAVTVGLTVFEFVNRENRTNELHKLYAQSQIYQRAYFAFAKACPNFYNAPACRFVTQEIQPHDMTNLEPVLAKLKTRPQIDAKTQERLENTLRNLPVFLRNQEPILKHIKEFSDFMVADKYVRETIKAEGKKNLVLTKENMSWLSLLKAQFVHSDWAHLAGNMLILILFSLFLEQRVGHLLYLGIYLISGSVGLFTELQFIGEGVELLGASANVLGIIAAYTFFFARERLVLVGEATIPAWFLVFFVVGGSEAYQWFTGHFQVVAGIGHGAGFVGGFISAWLFSQIVWVQNGFLFLEEQTAFLRAKKAANPSKKIKHALEILEINKSSLVAVDYIFRTLSKYGVDPHHLDPPTHAAIGECVVALLRRKFSCTPKETVTIISNIPLQWNLGKLGWPKLDKDILKDIDNMILENDWRVAIRLYDLYLDQHRSAETLDAIRSTVQKIIVHLESPLHPNSHQNIEWFRRYGLMHSQTTLGALIKEKFPIQKSA